MGLVRLRGARSTKRAGHIPTHRKYMTVPCASCIFMDWSMHADKEAHYDDVPSSIGIAFGRPRRAQALLVCAHDLAAGVIRQEDAAWGQPAFR